MGSSKVTNGMLLGWILAVSLVAVLIACAYLLINELRMRDCMRPIQIDLVMDGYGVDEADLLARARCD